MKNTNIIKVISISLITLIILSIVGYSYAYFSLEIEGTGKDVIMSTADLRLIYKDDTELKLVDAMPGDSVSKVITVNNVGTKSATYSLYWGNLINTIQNFELHVTLECKSYINYGETNQTESGTCDKIYRAVPISNTVTTGNIKKNISIEPGITQEYTVTIKFDNKNYSQDDNINKTFTGKIGIEEYTAPEEVNCTFDGELTQGAEYVNGQYTYRYKQENALKYDLSTKTSVETWTEISADGWGVQLTDRTSTVPVTSEVCTYINDKPVVSMSNMFYNSPATIINVSNFDTSNVTNMSSMFYNTKASTLDVSNFDTSNVTGMSGMFSKSSATTLDIGNFDTSKVTNMSNMFTNSQATTLDVSNFDTSKVTDMANMFLNSRATGALDASNFDTSKVTNMSYMFYNSQATTLDVSNFDTSNVTNMSGMFYNTKASTLDVSNFDTSNVTGMSGMFSKSSATTLDIGNFDTSKVTNMSDMFSGSKATTLDVSNFDTSKVTSMSYMFYGSKATTLDVSNFDTSNVTNMSGMFYNTKASTLDVSSFDTSNVAKMDGMFYNCNALTTIYVGNKFTTDKVTSSSNMFNLSTKLVGGAGTVYNSSYVDKTYARVDGGTSSPGYFTLKTN